MKLILNTADFSANNIGQVEVPINYANETLAYLDAIPTASASLTDNEKRGINSFFRGLINNSLYSKMERIYIPRFGNVEGGVNLVNPAQTKLNLPVSGGGVTYDINGVLLGTNYFTANFAHGLDNKFMGFANKTAVSSIPDAAFRSVCLNYAGFVGLGRVHTGGQSQAGLVVSGSDRALVLGRSLSTGYILTSTDDDTDVRSVIVDGEYVTDPKETAHANTELYIGGQNQVGHTDCKHHISLLLFGQKLNQSEMSLLGGLIDNLMAAV